MIRKRIGIVSILIVSALACNLPGRNLPASNLPVPSAATHVVPTITLIAQTPTIATFAPVVLSSNTASMTPTPQNPLIIQSTLCLEGPGPKYAVVSALRQNERVILLGRGSISGWFIVENPTYHDPCWVAAGALQLDSGHDPAKLKIFTPPPPTPTP